MKTLTAFLLLVQITSCSQTDKQVDSSILNTKNTKAQATPESRQTSDPVQPQISDFNCVRAVPEASLDLAVYPDRSFTLIDSTSATEAVGLNNGDRLIINHGGCEYFVQTYRFETTRWHSDSTDVLFWYKKALKLLGEIEKADQSPIDMKAGITAMGEYIEQHKEIKLEHEIDFADSEIRHFVTLDRIEQLDQGKFAVEVTFAIGPL